MFIEILNWWIFLVYQIFIGSNSTDILKILRVVSNEQKGKVDRETQTTQT